MIPHAMLLHRLGDRGESLIRGRIPIHVHMDL
jgi:hypothetical protein